MTGAFSALDALGDAFLSLGGAAALSFIYHLVFFSPPRSRWLSCAAHAAFFALAGVVGFCFVAGATAARAPRWYMLAGAAAGAAAYIKCFSSAVARAVTRARKLLSAAMAPLLALARHIAFVLQKPFVRVYNRSVERRAERARRRKEKDGVDREGKSREKQPRRAYTQT